MIQRKIVLRRINLLTFFLLLVFLFQSIPSLNGNIKSIVIKSKIILNAEKSNYSNTISNVTGLENIINNFSLSLKDNKEGIYMYIDSSDEQGTMNYYKMRYYFIPAKSVKYQYFGYQSFSEELYVELIQRFSVEYIVVHKDNGILNFLSIPTNNTSNEDVVIKIINNKAEKLSDMIKKV